MRVLYRWGSLPLSFLFQISPVDLTPLLTFPLGRGCCHLGPQQTQCREGRRCSHQEGVRQEVQPHMALHRRPQLRIVRHPRDQALHLLLPRPGRYPALQERINLVLLTLFFRNVFY